MPDRGRSDVSGRSSHRRTHAIAAGLIVALIFLATLPRTSRADSIASATTSLPVPAASPKTSWGAAASSGSDATPISANPGASNIIPGTGLLGRTLGLNPDWGIEVGGLWIGDADYLVAGGVKPGMWSFNSVCIVNLNVDADKLVGLPGGSLDASLLQFNGQDANRNAGAVQGYDGLTGPAPLQRTELYELWWRQSLFEDKFILRIGKTIPTYDFNNVSRPLAVSDDSLKIPSVTGLLYTPIFKNPTLFGAMGGYYNSAYGVTVDIAPTRNFYFTYAFYDGALATRVQTGLNEAPVFNGHYFTIGEGGYAWTLGAEKKPGMVAVGGWAQTGELAGGGAKQDGAQGAYSYGSQRLWRRHAGVDNSGVIGFFQLGFNDSRTMIINRYLGLGFTGFGLVPGRPIDSIGGGLAWSWLNRRYGFRSNAAMLQTYYQMHLIGTSFLEPALSYIPNPGHSPQTQGALALTAEVIVLF